MLIDLNVAVREEDNPTELMEVVSTQGLDAVVIAHDAGQGVEAKTWQAAGDAAGVRVFFGTRAATNRGELLCLVPDDTELSGNWAEKDDDMLDAGSVIDAVQERGGVTIALRPYDRDVEHPMGDHLFALQGLTACEVFNGQSAQLANDLALEAASNMEMPCVGGSGAQESASVGRAATLLRTPANDQGELIERIRQGDCWPVSFSDRAPRAESGRNGRSRRGGRGGGQEGRGRRGGGEGRSSEGRNGGGRRGGRSGGGGRRRSGGGNVDGNILREDNGPSIAEDLGNRRVDESQPAVDDNLGNRLAPGEDTPYNFNQD